MSVVIPSNNSGLRHFRLVCTSNGHYIELHNLGKKETYPVTEEDFDRWGRLISDYHISECKRQYLFESLWRKCSRDN